MPRHQPSLKGCSRHYAVTPTVLITYEGDTMHCSLCRSGDHAEFNVEMNIHLSGLEKVGHLGVLLIQRAKVCMGCGQSRFTTPEDELAQLVFFTEKASFCA